MFLVVQPWVELQVHQVVIRSWLRVWSLRSTLRTAGLDGARFKEQRRSMVTEVARRRTEAISRRIDVPAAGAIRKDHEAPVP